MGEDGGAIDAVVAVDSVDAVEDRDAEAGGQRPPLHAIDHVSPLEGGGALGRAASAGAKDAPDR